MKALLDTLYISGTIAGKDILDALKNKTTRINIVIMVGMVVFFYWIGTWRPFDQDVSVVVYAEGAFNPSFEPVTLGNGARYTFVEASSLKEMEQKMANRTLGLVLPADVGPIRASGGRLTLSGYVFWVDRMKVAELEAKYSQAFSEILKQPVQVVIAQNIVVPLVDVGGMEVTLAEQLVYFIFWVALMLIPYLMLEERQTKTMDALLTSPASPGQVVLGKALAGLFYILIVGALAFAFNRDYIVNWGLALIAFLGYALLAIGLGLAVGSFIKTPIQLGLWTVVLILFLVIPPLFYLEPMLKAGIREVLTWFPSSALASLFRFSCTTGMTPALYLQNLAVVIVSIAAAFGLVTWKVRRSDR